jgi:hypothetical protein
VFIWRGLGARLALVIVDVQAEILRFGTRIKGVFKVNAVDCVEILGIWVSLATIFGVVFRQNAVKPVIDVGMGEVHG